METAIKLLKLINLSGLFFLVAGLKRLRDARIKVGFQNIRFNGAYGRANSAQLYEYIGTIAPFPDHFLHALDLPGDTVYAWNFLSVIGMLRFMATFIFRLSHARVIYPVGVCRQLQPASAANNSLINLHLA
jgi:hypothetical protein